MNYKILGTAAAFGLLAMAASAPAMAATYSNTHDGDINSFGYPDTTTYGQAFTAPGGVLNDWTFYDQDGSNDGARLVIAQWNGSQVVGGEMFSELTQTVTSVGGEYAHTYSGINLNLTAGSSYIAYITVAGVVDYTGDVLVGGSNSSPLGGLFVFNNSGGADPLTNNNDWYTSGWSPANMQYTADFGAVPEPATWAMMMVGVFGLGGALRRRREQTAVATTA